MTPTTIDFSGFTLPFAAGDIVSAAGGLVTQFGPYILLGIALMYVPKFIALIKNAVGGKGKKA